jgi:hypothetical protein
MRLWLPTAVILASLGSAILRAGEGTNEASQPPGPSTASATAPPAGAAPAASPSTAGGADATKSPEPTPWWEKVPPIRVLPRTGHVPIPPKGPGYYSLHDVLTDEWRENPPRYPYPPLTLIQFPFFEADFRYLDSPKNTQFDLFDPLKRVHLGDNWLFSTGGQVAGRHMNEVDSRLTTFNNSYDLLRARTYADLWYCDFFRAYAEFIYADTFNQDLAPLAIDGTRADMLNLFGEIKLAQINGKPAYVRVGRQELLLGSQRLVSPLDWAITRRTFQGIRGYRWGEKLDVDLFWVQPVIPDRQRFDSVDNNVNLAGAWTTYRPEKDIFFDLYYLFLDNTSQITRLGLNTGPFNVHTLGTRYYGAKKEFLWDVEAMLQLGEQRSQQTVAGATTVGAGYHFADLPLNPTLWVYHDWASGDHSPGTGDTHSTFNQIFPFGHFYLGWIDLVGRQNIQDLNFHFFLYPTKWIQVWTQYHHFWLDSSRDALYNAAGVPIRRDATGRAGHNVGDEIDLVVNFHLSAHSDILLGYSKLFAGGFIDRTGPSVSPELFYFMYSFRW